MNPSQEDLDFTLYEKEFGHGLSLHDGEIIDATITASIDGADMLLTHGLFDSPAGSEEESGYTYRLDFHDYEGPDPTELIGLEIYQDEFERIDHRWQVSFILLPEGETFRFDCARVSETSLKGAPYYGHSANELGRMLFDGPNEDAEEIIAELGKIGTPAVVLWLAKYVSIKADELPARSLAWDALLRMRDAAEARSELIPVSLETLAELNDFRPYMDDNVRRVIGAIERRWIVS